MERSERKKLTDSSSNYEVGDVILADMRNGIWWPCIIKNGGFAYFWSDKTSLKLNESSFMSLNANRNLLTASIEKIKEIYKKDSVTYNLFFMDVKQAFAELHLELETSNCDGEPIDTVTDETNPVTVTSSGEKNMATPKYKRKPFGCPVCKKAVYDLNRHLKFIHHVKENYRSKYPDVIRSRKRNSKAKRRLKQCDICNTYSYRHDRHILTEKHKKMEMVNNGAKQSEENVSQSQDTPCSESNTQLKDFVAYLQSFMGGTLKREVAMRHKHNALRILQMFDLKDCPKKLGDVIEENLKNNWKPNTARTYLNSYRLYLTFLTTMVSVNDSYKDVDLQRIGVVKTQIGRIASTLGSLAAKEKQPMHEKNDYDRVNPTDLKMYFESNRAHEGKELLSSKFNHTRTNHTAVRNYLLMRLATSNAHRTACISNMQISEFKNSQSRLEKQVVLVYNHKTVKTYGPAKVVMEKDLYKDILHYIDNYRPKSNNKEVFLSWSGATLDAGVILNAFATELGHVGLEKKMSCTQLRHLTVSIFSAAIPEERNDLASVMCHSGTMQEHTYNDAIKSSRAVRSSNIIQKILTNQELDANDFKEPAIELTGFDIEELREKVNSIKRN